MITQLADDEVLPGFLSLSPESGLFSKFHEDAVESPATPPVMVDDFFWHPGAPPRPIKKRRVLFDE